MMEVSRQQAEALASRYLPDLSHSRGVAVLAERLFDCCRPLHQLGDDARELLVVAALLHDIGWCDGQAKHHKRAYELILRDPLRGLSASAVAIIANVARYHRKALPSLSHEGFASLDPEQREAVRKLAALLRIADGLDATHTSRVVVESCDIGAEEAVISLMCDTDCLPEIYAADKKSDLFEEIFGLKAKFRVSTSKDSIA